MISEEPQARSLEVLSLVDLHWSGKSELQLPDLSDVDLVLLGGDLTHFRGIEHAKIIIERIEATSSQVLAICGNCDKPEIESYLEEKGIALDRRARTLAGARFVGLSAGLPFGDCPYERTEAEFSEASDEAWRQADLLEASAVSTIFLCHQPPRDTVCDLARGRHVGSTAIRRSILDHEPDLVLCGHIHEAIGEASLGASRVINPGPWFTGHTLRFRIVNGHLAEIAVFNRA